MLKRSRQGGFNIIEVVVAVSILALLAAAALPGMTDWIRSTRLRGVAETTQVGLNKARTEAMKRNQVVTFWLVSRPSPTATPDDTCALASDSAAWAVSLDSPAGACGATPSVTAAPRLVEAYGPNAGSGDIVIASKASDGTAATSVSFNGYGQVVRTGKPLASIDITHVSATGRKLRLQVSTSGSVRLCDIEAVLPDSRACT